MKTTYLLLLPVILVCCRQNEDSSEREYAAAVLSAPPPVITASYEAAPVDIPDNEPVQIMERKLIRNGRIEFRAHDVTITKTELSKICKALHGYLSNETQSDREAMLSYSQTIRVPEVSFDELLAKTENLAEHIDHRSVEAEDVTEEYIDIESRLKAKRQLEKRYLDLLNKAQKVEDLLQIETEMSKVRADIESMQGRLNYLHNRLAYSTLDVTYYQTKAVQAEFGFMSRVAKSLGSGWDDVLAFVVRTIAAWPMWFAGIVTAIIGMKYWKKRKKRLAMES